MVTSLRANPFERAVFTRARRLCLSFPETTETASGDHPNFRAGRKTFCTFEMIKGRPSIAFRLSPVDVTLALSQKHGFATPYGRGLWASLWLDSTIDWKLVATLLDRSYRIVATKQMQARMRVRHK
jgi:predicted DNA-binding protein (MmcQ/YjbR family)